MIEDEEITDEERREAEALAHALERGSAREDLPEDALQTAALLRYGRDGGALPPDRAEAVLSDVLEAADRIAARTPERRRPPRWGWVLGAVGLAAALMLFVWLRPRGPTTATALPTPDPAVLEARLAGDDARFDDAMGDYRGAVYAALEERYGAR